VAVLEEAMTAGTRWKRERLWHRVWRHHVPLGLASGITVAALYFTRPYPDPIMRGSFSTAYPALFLLLATLMIGPVKALLGRRNALSQDLRRDVGIWAGIVGLAHVAVGQMVHFRGRPWLYYVYPAGQHHPLQWLPVRHDLFGITNYTGALGALLLLTLFATSNDVMLRRLGTRGWKKLQRWNYAVFVLVAVHTAGFMTIERQKVWFVATAAVGVAVTVALQGAGYVRRRQRA
jgi:sulfoxide reductase heme-binding subunit YedZ